MWVRDFQYIQPLNSNASSLQLSCFISGWGWKENYFGEYRLDKTCWDSLNESREYSIAAPSWWCPLIIKFILITNCFSKLGCDLLGVMQHTQCNRTALWCSADTQHHVFFSWDYSDFKVWAITKLVWYQGVLIRENAGKTRKNFDKFQVVWLSVHVFTTLKE